MVMRWTSTSNFNTSTGMSPTGVALEPSKCKIYFLTWSYVTSVKENYSLLLEVSLIRFLLRCLRPHSKL